MEASSLWPKPLLESSECRLGEVVVVVCVECVECEWRDGEEDRRREKMVRERVGEVVVAGGGETVSLLEKKGILVDW